jgi:hypothetical protein
MSYPVRSLTHDENAILFRAGRGTFSTVPWAANVA